MKTRFLNIGIFIIMLLLSMASCSKVFDDFQEAKVDFTTELGLHLSDVSLYFDQSLNFQLDTLIPGTPEPVIELSPNEDGVLTLYLSQEFPPLILDSILDISQVSLDDTIGFPAIFGVFIEGNLSFGFQLKTFKQEFLEGKKIDSLKLDKGDLQLEFNTYNQFYSEFNISFPGITNEKHQPLTIENYTPTAENNSLSFDLSNYKIEVLEKNGKEYFIINLDFYIESLDDETSVEPKIAVKLGNLDLDYAYGVFGTDSIGGFGEQKIALPGELIKGQDITINFDKPEINLLTLNSFSLPLRFNIKNVLMHFPDESIDTITGFPDQIDIDAPSLDNPGVYKPSTVQLDPSTNFDLLMSKGPILLTLDGDLWTNPDNPNEKNYIRDRDYLASVLNINIPFQLSVSEIVLQDTSNTTIFKDLDNETVTPEQIKIKAFITNNYPFDLDLQVYFLDENKQVIDKLFDVSTIINGPKQDDGITHRIIYVNKNQEQIKKLYATSKIAVVARFKTSDAEEDRIVSFKNDQKLDIGLTIFSSLNIDTGNEL